MVQTSRKVRRKSLLVYSLRNKEQAQAETQVQQAYRVRVHSNSGIYIGGKNETERY